MRRANLSTTGSIQSKTALPTYGSLHVTIMFSIMEDGRRKKLYKSDGQSKYVNNVKANVKTLQKHAVYNAVKKEFPIRSVTPYNIIMLSYHFVYLARRYQVTEKEGKYYERYRDTEFKRTRYIRIKDAYTSGEVEYYKNGYN